MAKILEINPLEGYPPEIGTWLWAMEEARAKTKSLVEQSHQNTLDWQGDQGNENAIGTLLYHIALVEMSWLFLDILEKPLPKEHFPWPMTKGKRLTPVLKTPLEEHLQRLDDSRKLFLEAFKTLSTEDWSELRSPKDVKYSVSPAWAVFHLVEHEAGYAAQITTMIKRMQQLK